MEKSRWLTDEQQAAWRRLIAVTTLLPYELEAQLSRDSDLTHFGYWALAMLSEEPGHALRMSELAARSTASVSRISHAVAKLEARGWVRREKAADDGRGNVAVLTDAGLAKIVGSARGHVDTVQNFVFDVLTPEQVRQLDGICAALLTRLDPSARMTHGCDGEAVPR